MSRSGQQETEPLHKNVNHVEIAKHLKDSEEVQDVTGISPFWKQALGSSPPIIASISSGMLFGYSATLIPELQKPDSDIQVNLEYASWIASTVPLLMSFGCLVGGTIMGRYGRKNAHFILCIPKLLGWLTIYLAPNFAILLVGRILGGLSAGLLATLFPTYLGEVSEPKYRGFFLVAPSTALALGILATHLLGTFLHWRTVALLASILPLITVIVLFLVPETPCWLISQNRFDEALKAFRWLRGSSISSKREFEQMWDKHKETEAISEDSFWNKAFVAFRRPEFVKPFAIIFCCFFTMQFSGPYIVAFYSVSILSKILGTTMNEYLVMNAIDVLRLVMVIIASGLLRTVRRRVLLLTSGIGTTISAIGLAVFIFATRYYPHLMEFSWFSVILLVSYIFFISIGIFVLPWCMAGELYPLDCRSLGSSLNISINFFLFFICVKIAPALFESLGIDGAFLFYGGIALMGTVVLGIVLPETKDRTLVDIQMQFIKKKEEITRNNV
ncbi:facilitated trehalose transporter Tret1-like [Culicoides brevitarsis]|uniref:facilitated trehalose transporter Tret1-like n=1 Tax=Culicoides brevitarsis TaxID=469753 RepID=UPI00307CA48D